ncbi:Hypothetical predicted protein [Podarcis lilfordi]|uniref:Uncharacterized protein n=1 Tax=Podarcis lilfordi TaxID=74358 RepID=A0AA35LHB3_9SAUR|nr:Hypothetical predicted protein [Podarcis lilfordi]
MFLACLRFRAVATQTVLYFIFKKGKKETNEKPTFSLLRIYRKEMQGLCLVGRGVFIMYCIYLFPFRLECKSAAHGVVWQPPIQTLGRARSAHLPSNHTYPGTIKYLQENRGTKLPPRLRGPSMHGSPRFGMPARKTREGGTAVITFRATLLSRRLFRSILQKKELSR